MFNEFVYTMPYKIKGQHSCFTKRDDMYIGKIEKDPLLDVYILNLDGVNPVFVTSNELTELSKILEMYNLLLSLAKGERTKN